MPGEQFSDEEGKEFFDEIDTNKSGKINLERNENFYIQNQIMHDVFLFRI